MAYRYEQPVMFQHCDPAGIVFYPRYFEMVNSVIENFFADVVGRSFASMHFGADNGVPTVAMEAVFQKPSRLGDKVRFTLRVEKVGGSSVTMWLEGYGPDGLRTATGPPARNVLPPTAFPCTSSPSRIGMDFVRSPSNPARPSPYPAVAHTDRPAETHSGRRPEPDVRC